MNMNIRMYFFSKQGMPCYKVFVGNIFPTSANIMLIHGILCIVHDMLYISAKRDLLIQPIL